MDELTGDQLHRWRDILANNPALDSPYFHPAFATAVAATHPAVRIVVVTAADGHIRSFLPVQIDGRRATPAGYPAADFQGPICEPGEVQDLEAVVRACGVSCFRFDHWLDGGAADLARWPVRSHLSPFIDVSGGEVGYRARASKAGRDNLSQARRRAARAERELGPFRFQASSRDPALLDQIVELKRGQYRATGARDFFAVSWHRRLLSVLLDTHDDDFEAMMSAVFAGPHLLAAHFGIRRSGVLHWWFPTYNPRFAGLGPGWLLLRELVRAAPGLGLVRIDLGRGNDEYKRRAMTGAQTVYEGAAYRGVVRRRCETAKARALQTLRSSAAAPAVRALVHGARRLSG